MSLPNTPESAARAKTQSHKMILKQILRALARNNFSDVSRYE